MYGMTGDRNMEPDVIVTRDWNGPNSGVVLIKNSDFSRWFLKEWWDQDQFVHGKFPFNYEQVRCEAIGPSPSAELNFVSFSLFIRIFAEFRWKIMYVM